MKPLMVRSGLFSPRIVAACLMASTGLAPAASILLDFGPTTVADGFTILSPGHALGTVSSTTETTWNKITTSAQVSSLDWGNGDDATGIILTMGQGLKSGTTINYSTGTTFASSIPGNGGSVTTNEKLTTNKGTSIYGAATGSSSVGLDALFTADNDTAIGFRLDGLVAGSYVVYVMARNSNTNSLTGAGMNVYASAGASGASSFNYSTVAAQAQANTGYTTGSYVNQFGSFIANQNYVSIPITVGEDQSIFVGVEGQGTGGAGRGFINMIQIVQVPEPSVSLLGAVGVLALFRRRRQD